MEIVYKDESFQIIGAALRFTKRWAAVSLSPSIKNAWSWNWQFKDCHLSLKQHYACVIMEGD